MTRIGWIVLAAILLVAGVFASMVGFGGSAPPASTPLAPARLLAAKQEVWTDGGRPQLAIPVAGIDGRGITDSWGDARSGGRGHKGIDIMAAAGAPVVAAASGRVEKLFESRLGGTTLYQRSPDGRWTFYYAHLQRYAPGVREGMAVKAGDLIGFVGDTGTGSGGNPHLHFSVARLRPEQRWWEGEDVNPYPLLRGR